MTFERGVSSFQEALPLFSIGLGCSFIRRAGVEVLEGERGRVARAGAAAEESRWSQDCVCIVRSG